MWRIANSVYRAFRNTATHRCSQDVLGPLTTIHNTDDDDSDLKKKEKCTIVKTSNIYEVLKNNQFSYDNIEKIQEDLKKISFKQVLTKKTNVVKSIETQKSNCIDKEVSSTTSTNQTEETLDSLLQADKTYMNTLKDLSDLHEETMSIINLEIALDAIKSGNYQLGIEALENSAKNKTNAAALYNLGICYEQGIGVEADRAKACDYFRQASALGHTNAQFHLTNLSNHIDIDDNEDERSERTISENNNSLLRKVFLQFSLSMNYKDEPSFNNYQFESENKTIACL
ncbi:unnamed protein product [Adineta steineri]|uniref:Death ligand signal enhancer n=1 Tax=Adineta steineri TaxID=433720 RepID=A0A813ZAL7_9BILA|nr:unnamed protein product [Adineta steineri]CAF4000926.1 unnamed protein product [Adineta steineri]